MRRNVHKYFQKAGMVFLVMLLLVGISSCANHSDPVPDEKAEQPAKSTNTMTGEDLMKELKIGWNLGNTFDAPEGETSWGNPFTTKELLAKVKELGFNTIRIPISWGKHVSEAPEYVIDEAFLNRVDAVVNDALDAGLYVIINSHHDNEIYTPIPENEERAKTYLNALWSQIAEHFKDADYRLIFQTMNEPRVVGTSYEWNIDTGNKDCLAAMEVVNNLNQVSVDAIRATGSNNADRFIVVSPYVANAKAATTTTFRLPEDSAEGKLIVSIHAYTPYNLCLNINSPEAKFALNHLSEIKSFMKNINYRFVQKGIPVIIDEMGCIDKENPEARYAWAKAYVSAAAEYGMPCVWWDNGQVNGTGENFGLIDRRNLEVYEDSISVWQGLMEGLVVEEN